MRTDFVSRPPSIPAAALPRILAEQQGKEIPFVGCRDLARIKMTNREKDYAVIGELARIMPDVEDRIFFSRSARDLLELTRSHPDIVEKLAPSRPLLRKVPDGREALEAALDAERRALLRENEERLQAYGDAARAWAALWPKVSREIEGRPLREAHAVLVAEAEGVLPVRVEGAERWIG